MSQQSPQPELLCVSCGYSLQGLPTGGACPECGAPIERSLQGNRLFGADRKWLRRIVRGQDFVAYGMLLIGIGGGSVLFFPILMMILYLWLGIETDWIGVVIVVAMFSAIAGLLLLAIGCWLVTAQDPRESLRESAWSARNIARWGTITTLALVLFAQMMWYGLSLPPDVFMLVRFAVVLVIVTLLGISASAMLRWLAALVQRVPERDLAKRMMSSARFLVWALPVGVMSFMLGGAVTGAMGPIGLILGLAACAGVIVMLVVIAHTIMLTLMMFACRRQFRRCLQTANERG